MIYSFADIILPVAVKGSFTYSIPDEFSDDVKPGMRVLVRFGNRKIYSGIICKLHNVAPDLKNIRPIMELADTVQIANERQLAHWRWISDYYLCSRGEVMNAAVPSAFFPEGDISTSVIEKYSPREEMFIVLAKEFTDKELNEILDKLKKAPKQAEFLITYLDRTGYTRGSEIFPVRKSSLLKESGSSPEVFNALVKKGIMNSVSLEVGRLKDYGNNKEPLKILSESQQTAFNSIKNSFNKKDIVLLHGVTSSGKTEIYIHLIEEQLKLGKQVLYMLPEIALTTQIILRLQKHFGAVTGVYHSRFNDQEKVEIWKRVADEDPETGYRLILGVRSSIFLPFSDLGLVIIDEEHDGSYKQHDPAPRYHARDSAIILAALHKAKTLLGSASPSVESYNNTINGKYGLAELKERYSQIKLPEIIVANTREAYRKKLMVSHFTPELLHAVDEALGKNEQVVLFQNRRGFSPYVECPECGWIPVCIQCAVNLTYHKGINKMMCHYCGYSSGMPHACGNCGSTGLVTRGFGTEKIEDEIKIVFPAARVGRMDQDTTRSKNSFNRIIRDFEEQRIDILIGTQMISKGLDFENLTVVGILNADNLLNYPDFRAHERSFQLIEQVSGRAGRRKKQGKVIIQTSDPGNKIIRLVLRHDYLSMFRIQSEERATFNYPPFCRMIRISLKHKERSSLNHFADILGNDLKGLFGKRILGPEFPVISQIQLWYIKTILIKIERERSIVRAKDMIRDAISRLEKEKGAGGLKIAIDVDPY
ncbi:MAG: primosomal protein N' [Bacteroidales bacterium]|jgi:primosomal protein N' (replication factor Y)|nr:primosomal protein N' [Bacteroidales bacterium]